MHSHGCHEKSDISEYNVDELVNININGTQNVATAAAENNVGKIILLSTDKAVNPVSAYGVSKLMAEKIFLWADKTQNVSRYSVLRSGNFCDSRGNVFEIWKKQFEKGIPLTVTRDKMVRYYIKNRSGCGFSNFTIKDNAWRGDYDTKDEKVQND